jgi:hypothetical protein
LILAEVAPAKNGVSAADIAPVAVAKARKDPTRACSVAGQA